MNGDVWGSAVKAILLAIGVSTVSQAAHAQDFMISPDGAYVARHIPELETDERNLPRHRLEIISVDCLRREPVLDQCVVLSPPSFRRGNRPRWSIDSNAFVSGIPQILFGLDGSAKPLRGYPWAIEPRVIDLAGPDGNGPPSIPNDRDGMLVVNGQGLLVARQRWKEDHVVIASVAGHSLEVSKLAVVAGDAGSARQWIYPGVSGDTFFYWSPSLGERGRLVQFTTDGLTDVPLPISAKGPLRIVADEATNEPVAVLDAFGVRPLSGKEVLLDWLVRGIESLRTPNQPLVKSVAAAIGAKVAIVRLQPGLSDCVEDWLVTAEKSVRVSPACGSVRDVPYGVSHVDLTGSIYLPARLYRSSAISGSARNLIIYMHGGPNANSLDVPMMDMLYADPRFDVLAVDFRGSSGIGFELMRALKPPVGDISTEDLRLAVDWARAQPQYHSGILGVWGSSWGGLSAHAITSRDSSGIDFLISNSGFIELPPGVVDELCELSGWVTHVYGAYVDYKGDCLAAYSGVLGRKVTTRAAFLALSAGNEQLGTPFKTEMTWAKQARRDGACVSTLYSESGWHAGQCWPEASRARVQDIIREWIDSVSERSRETCGTDFRLP